MGIHCPILTHQILLSVLDSVINKADKGSTIVILTRSDYIHRGMNHLADEATYEPLLEDISSELITNINHQLHKLYTNGLLTEPMYKFCQPPLQSRTSRIVSRGQTLFRTEGNGLEFGHRATCRPGI